MKKNYGEILKQAIKNNGFKQKELAEKMGETPQNLSNWLNRNDLTVYNFVRICDAIGINPASIVDNGRDNFSDIDPYWIKFIREANSWDSDNRNDFYEYIDNGLKLLKKKIKQK